MPRSTAGAGAKSLERTLARRPDLLRTAPLTDEDRRYLATLGYEESHLTLTLHS